MVNLRKEWFLFVAQTRKKMQRKNKTKNVTHREAMSEASKSWIKQKEKIIRKNRRLEKIEGKTLDVDS